MTAQVINLTIPAREENKQHPMLSMFMVRRRENFKVITNLAQLSPQELVEALIRDAVWQEKEEAVKRLTQ